MRKIAAVIRKEFYQIKSDKFMLRFLVIAPFMQLIVLGYSLTMETVHVKTLICNLDKTAASRQIVEEIRNNDRFEIIGETDSYNDLEESLRLWKASIGLYIPPDFSRNLKRDGKGEVLALLDAVDGNKALTAFGYLTQIVQETAIIIAPRYVMEAFALGGGNITISTHYWYNPELKNQAYMVPGIVVLIITIITLMLGSMSIVREKERGTLEQLMVTPLKKIQLILGKQIPFLLYSFAEVIVILKLGEMIFHIHLSGSYLNLYLIIFLYLFTTLGLGLFVSTLAWTQQQALFIAWFFMVFLLLLSGFFIPVENMPGWLQYVTIINPLRYMMTAVREIYLKATPLKYLSGQVVPLFVLGATIFTASVLRFSKKVS